MRAYGETLVEFVTMCGKVGSADEAVSCRGEVVEGDACLAGKCRSCFYSINVSIIGAPAFG